MDNFGRHELIVTLDSVRNEFLPPRSSMDHQTLDLGLIAATMIHYRWKLLCSVLDIMEMKRITNHTFKESVKHERKVRVARCSTSCQGCNNVLGLCLGCDVP